jgi:hypothetical protein
VQGRERGISVCFLFLIVLCSFRSLLPLVDKNRIIPETGDDPEAWSPEPFTWGALLESIGKSKYKQHAKWRYEALAYTIEEFQPLALDCLMFDPSARAEFSKIITDVEGVERASQVTKLRDWPTSKSGTLFHLFPDFVIFLLLFFFCSTSQSPKHLFTLLY